MSGAQAMSPNADLMRRIEAALRQEFPQDTVDVTAGYADKFHVVVVSRQFDSLTEHAKQDLLWSVIDRADFADAEKTKISLMLAHSPGSLK